MAEVLDTDIILEAYPKNMLFHFLAALDLIYKLMVLAFLKTIGCFHRNRNFEKTANFSVNPAFA